MEIYNFKKYTKINEEFVGSLIQGALGKLFNAFKSAFKDLSNDFKSTFKEDDLSSIKDVVLKNVDQAMDSGQKSISALKSDGDVLGIMDNVVNSLIELSNNLNKDVETALGKEKAKPVEAIAKAILMGNKEADWVGIVGCLDPTQGITKKDINYNFSKKKYVEEVNKGKNLKEKQNIATKFFDNFQKSIKSELDKGFTDEELKNVYSKIMGGDAKTDYKEGDTVIYLRKGKKKEEYDPKKPAEKQSKIVGIKKIDKIEGDKVFFSDRGGEQFIKTLVEIIGKSEDQGGENAKKAAEILGKIKTDEEKMSKVVKFSEFLLDDKNKNKLGEIEKIMQGGETSEQ